jgi:hypothetical protein
MARTAATTPAGMRLTDHISLNHVAVSQARIRLGAAPPRAFDCPVVAPVATHGIARCMGWRLAGDESRWDDARSRRHGGEMLCRADRGFLSFNLWHLATSTSAALVWRARATVTLPVLRREPAVSYRSEVRRRANCAGRRTGGAPSRALGDRDRLRFFLAKYDDEAKEAESSDTSLRHRHRHVAHSGAARGTADAEWAAAVGADLGRAVGDPRFPHVRRIQQCAPGEAIRRLAQHHDGRVPHHEGRVGRRGERHPTPGELQPRGTARHHGRAGVQSGLRHGHRPRAHSAGADDRRGAHPRLVRGTLSAVGGRRHRD